MKRWVIGLLCLLAVSAFTEDSTGTDFRVFTDLQGRVIEARILDSKPDGTVQIERRNGQKAWVKPDIFCETDETYITAWIAAQDLLSNSKLSLSAKKKTGTKVAGTQAIAELITKVTPLSYVLELHNRSGNDFKELTIDYRLYIEEKGYNKWPDGKRCVAGSMTVNTLAAGEKTSFETTPEPLIYGYVNVYVSETYGRRSIDQHKKREDEVTGIWFKIRGPLVGGKPVTRDFPVPPDLGEKEEWIETPKAFLRR